jgi:hypothetical protein
MDVRAKIGDAPPLASWMGKNHAAAGKSKVSAKIMRLNVSINDR